MLIVLRGHTLGSHTWSHKDMTTLTYDEIHDELYRVEEAFIRILGKKPLYVSPSLLLDSFNIDTPYQKLT